jgi:outer membrane protein insertion porin family
MEPGGPNGVYIIPMKSLFLLIVALAGASTSVAAQIAGAVCARPDSIAVRGNTRVSAVTIRSEAGVASGMSLDLPAAQRAVRAVMATGEFDDAELLCEVDGGGRHTLVIAVDERPVLGAVTVTGTNAVSERAVRDQLELPLERALDPALVARAVARIDSLYESRGYYLARVVPDTTVVAGGVTLEFTVDEGRRLAVAGHVIEGNERLSDRAVVSAMGTRPEGFWWFQRGEFDEITYTTDLTETLPQHYARRGFVDMRVVRDTVMIDRERGKAMIELAIEEGPQYRVGNFEVLGNRQFSAEELERYYPFGGDGPTIADRVTGILRRDRIPAGVFNAEAWEQATDGIRTAYHNEGYIQAEVRPVVTRRVDSDSVPTVDLRWDIREGSPAIINRVEIAGNDYTTEACIRDAIVVLPGARYNRDNLVQSYQRIANMGFFETPLPTPEVRPANEAGDVDVIFHVSEKKTGNINFGASVGGGGVGGFIGLDQPNLFGQCKRGSLQWQFGQLINDFNLSYSDPSIRKSNYSGTVNAYHSRARYVVSDFGRQIRTGGNGRVGFPIFNSPFTRMFVSYGGEAVRYERDDSSLLGQLADQCDNCFRSTAGATIVRDTRIGLPFAIAGSLRNIDAQFNGGPLGGTANFQRYTAEMRGYSPLGSIGGDRIGSEPMQFVLGLTMKMGTVFGNTGPFFPFQEFAMGGTQQGEPLRGYDEFTITPAGFSPTGSRMQAQRASFGRAYYSSTVELGLRVSSGVYVHMFHDAGNVWNHPREFDPTRLYRGAGFGVAVITPLGPLGIDWAYGFDRLNQMGRPDPQWKLHFKLGQMF